MHGNISVKGDSVRGFVDSALIFVIIFIFAVVLLIGFFISNSFNSKLGQSGYNTTNTERVATNIAGGFQAFNTGIVFLFFGSMLAVILSVAFLNTHPVWFIVSIILFAIMLFVCAILSNTYTSIASANTDITATANKMIETSWIMDNLPILALIMFAGTTIALFARPRSSPVSSGYYEG